MDDAAIRYVAIEGGRTVSAAGFVTAERLGNLLGYVDFTVA